MHEQKLNEDDESWILIRFVNPCFFQRIDWNHCACLLNTKESIDSLMIRRIRKAIVIEAKSVKNVTKKNELIISHDNTIFLNSIDIVESKSCADECLFEDDRLKWLSEDVSEFTISWELKNCEIFQMMIKYNDDIYQIWNLICWWHYLIYENVFCSTLTVNRSEKRYCCELSYSYRGLLCRIADVLTDWERAETYYSELKRHHVMNAQENVRTCRF